MAQLIPRREFLRLAAATAVSIGLDPFLGVSVSDDVYQNERLGLRLRRPPGWEFDSIADFAAVQGRQVLRDALANQQHPLRDPGNLPVFIIVDPAHRQGDFAPAVCLYDEPLDDTVPYDEAAAHQENLLQNYGTSYNEFRVLGEPRLLALAGSRATVSAWRYRHELDDGRSWLLRIRSVLVFRPPRVHIFHLVDSDEHLFVPSGTFDGFLRSVTYRSV